MNYQQRRQKTYKKPRLRKWMILGGALVLVAVLGIIAWAFHHNTKGVISGRPTGTTTASPNTKGEPAVGNNSGGASSSTDKGTGGTGSSGGTTATLAAPHGNFVSNHHPNLSGSPAPNTEQSVCNTTPGASCQIVFTKDSISKTLPAQTTDSGGAVYWNWKLQDIDLTEGTWKVSARAILGSQTQSADDVIPFEVAQ